MILVSRSRFEATIDAATCEPCKTRSESPFNEGDVIDHPDCKNPDGCRCVVVVTLAPGQVHGFYMDGVPAESAGK